MNNRINPGLRMICMVAYLLMAVSSAIAQAYEPFNYPVGSGPGNGGTGWLGPWTPSGAVVVAPGLSFTGLATSGNALGGTPGSAATRLLATPLVGTAGTSVILRALIKSPVNGTPATQATVGNSPGGMGNNFIIGDLPQSSPNANKWGLQNDCGQFYSNKLVVANQTAYLVARIDFNVSGANDRMRLWVQTTGTAVPDATLFPTPADVDVMCNVNTFGGVFWQTQQGQVVDEIKVDNVRALPEPSELTVSLASDGGLTIRGTPGNDDVLLRLDPTGKKIEVDNLANRGGTDHSFDLALVRSIHIFLAAGDDRVIFDDTNGSLGVLRPLEIDVGDGDNTVIGSTGDLKSNEIADLGNTIAQLKKVLQSTARLRERAEKLTSSAGELAATDGVAFMQTADRYNADAQKQLIGPAEALRKDADSQIVAVADQLMRETPSVFFQQPEKKGSLLDPFSEREADAFVQRLDRLVAEAAKVADDEGKVGPLVDRMESEINSLTLAADKLEVRLQKESSPAESSPERRALQLEQAGDAFLARADKELLGSGGTLLVRADQELLGGGNAFSGRADAIAREADAISHDADALLEVILPVAGRLFEGTATAKNKAQATTQQVGCNFTTTNTISGSGLIIGTAGNDLLIGSSGTDFMFGGAGNDRMRGGAGTDIMFGNSGDDDMYGEAGNDLMFGNDGDDCMSGGDGIDLMFGNAGKDTMHGNDGPTVTFTISGATVSIKVGDLMFGNGDADQMYGDEGLDLMFGNAGKDTMHGNDGADFMFGNEDADTMYGEAGKGITITTGSNPPVTPPIGNFMFGNAEKDQMWGGVDRDFMWGNDDDDTMSGDAEMDFMFGNQGNDTMNGNDGIDFIFGNQGKDTLNGNAGSDFMFGNQGDDTMNGNDGIDFMFGNEDNDTMSGNAGTDFMFGNQGDDTMNGNDGIDFMFGNEDNDTMSGNAGTDFMFGNQGDDTMNGNDGIDFMFGNEDNDTMHGDAGIDFMWGNQGNDTMNGDDGVDFMWGNEDGDTMNGNAFQHSGIRSLEFT